MLDSSSPQAINAKNVKQMNNFLIIFLLVYFTAKGRKNGKNGLFYILKDNKRPFLPLTAGVKIPKFGRVPKIGDPHAQY